MMIIPLPVAPSWWRGAIGIGILTYLRTYFSAALDIVVTFCGFRNWSKEQIELVDLFMSSSNLSLKVMLKGAYYTYLSKRSPTSRTGKIGGV